MLRHPDNALNVGNRRRAGAPLVALAVAVDCPTEGHEWLSGHDTEWVGCLYDCPVGVYDFACAAGLLCLVHSGAAKNSRPVFVVERLYAAAAREVWLCIEVECWRVPRPQAGKPVVADQGPLTVEAVLSRARAWKVAA